MKRIGLLIVLLAVVASVVFGAIAATRTGARTASPESVQTALVQALTGPEGEYAAYASYAAVLDAYGLVDPYATIANAELRHIETLQRLLDKYGIDYPATNPFLGAIEAPADLETAAQAWADGEIANVALYGELLPEVKGYSDITRVFLNLQSASQNSHLPAFLRAAENGGTLASGQSIGRIASPLRQGSGNRSKAAGGRMLQTEGTKQECRSGNSNAASETCTCGSNRQGRSS